MAWLEIARRVVENHQHEEDEDGVILDAVTAHMLTTVHDALGENNKNRFADLSTIAAVELGWLLIHENKKTNSST